MSQWRKILFWAIVVLAAAVLTDPILSIQDMLGYNSFGERGLTYPNSWITSDWFVFHSYALHFGGPRSSMASWMLVAALIGLGALLTGRPRRNEWFFSPASVVFAAYAFRWTEVLTDMLMAEGLCLGQPVACPNVAMEFWNGNRFTVIAYLALGAAVVIGGALARKGWGRFVASPPPPAMPAAASAALVAEELQTPERAGDNPTEGTTLATAPALA